MKVLLKTQKLYTFVSKIQVRTSKEDYYWVVAWLYQKSKSNEHLDGDRQKSIFQESRYIVQEKFRWKLKRVVQKILCASHSISGLVTFNLCRANIKYVMSHSGMLCPGKWFDLMEVN